MSQTSSAFQAYSGVGLSERRWGPSLLTSSAVYLAIGLVAMVLGGKQAMQAAKKAVEVTFVQTVVKEPPPAPAAPAPVEKPQAPAAMAPVVRPDQKVRQLDKPPPPKRMDVPKEMPKEAPKEADASEDKGVAIYGQPGKGDAAGLEGGVSEGGTLGGIVGGAIALPEDGVPPVPVASNTIPPYPAEARAAGKTGTVILKVVILADGRVADVQVMRGDEPFVSAAVKTVKTWRYTPAQFKGQAITVYRIIQIPFKLTA